MVQSGHGGVSTDAPCVTLLCFFHLRSFFSDARTVRTVARTIAETKRLDPVMCPVLRVETVVVHLHPIFLNPPPKSYSKCKLLKKGFAGYAHLIRSFHVQYNLKNDARYYMVCYYISKTRS